MSLVNMLGGIAASISGLGNVFATSTQAVKQTALSTQNLSDVMTMFVVPMYRGKRRSLFKCDFATWGSSQNMKSRHVTVDGLFKEDFVSPTFTGTVSTSSTSTTSTI